MTSPHDPLPLPCGQVLPNRLMKAAMSEALSDAAHSPMPAWSGSTARGAKAATGCWSPAM